MAICDDGQGFELSVYSQRVQVALTMVAMMSIKSPAQIDP